MNNKIDKMIKDLYEACNDVEYRVAIIMIEELDENQCCLQLQANMNNSKLKHALNNALDCIKEQEKATLDSMSEKVKKLEHLLNKFRSENGIESLCDEHKSFVRMIDEVSGEELGGITIVKEMMEQTTYEVAKSTLEFCREKEIIGPYFWALYKDLCKSNIQNLINITTLAQAGIINPKLLKIDIEKGFEKSFDEMVAEC